MLFISIKLLYNDLEKRLTAFFGSFQIIFYQRCYYFTFRGRKRRCLGIVYATTHVPTYLHKFVLEIFLGALHVLQCFHDVRLRLCQQGYTKKFEVSNVTGTSYEAGAPFLICSSVAFILSGFTAPCPRRSVSLFSISLITVAFALSTNSLM